MERSSSYILCNDRPSEIIGLPLLYMFWHNFLAEKQILFMKEGHHESMIWSKPPLPPLHSLIAPFQPFAYPFGHRRCPLVFVLMAAINLVDWGKNSRKVRKHRILH